MVFKKFYLSLSFLVLLLGSTVALAEAGEESALSIHGRLAIDYINHLQKPSGSGLTNGAALRAADLNLGFAFSDSMSLRMDFEFSDKGVGIGTAFLKFSEVFTNTDLLLGQVPTPFCLDASGSSKYLSELERSNVSAFKPCIGPGFSLNHHQDSWAVKLAVRGPKLGQEILTGDGKKPRSDYLNDVYGGAVRATWAPINDDDKLIHLGGSFSYQMMGGDGQTNTLAFGSSEVKGRNIKKFEVTGIQAKNYMVAGVEIAPSYGPVQAEAEGAFTFVQTRDSSSMKDPMYFAYNIGLNWFITGQSRTYKVADGAFGAIDRGHVDPWGVWQVAVRYSQLDLSSDAVDANQRTRQNVTAAVNWYPTESLKLAANYVVSFDQIGTVADDAKGTLALRMQAIF